MIETSQEREPIFTASKKWRRAVLRQERLTFSVQEVAALLDVGMGKLIAQAAEDRLCAMSAERRPEAVPMPRSLPATEEVQPSSAFVGPAPHPAGGEALLATLRKRRIQQENDDVLDAGCGAWNRLMRDPKPSRQWS